MNFNKANMMKGKDRFTSAEIVKLRELITERQMPFYLVHFLRPNARIA